MSQVLEKQTLIVEDAGAAKIAGTRIKVAQVILEYTRLGQTPEQIAESHPHLPLAQIQAALDYYGTHRESIEAQIAASLAYADEAQQASEPSELAKRLTAEKQSTRRTG
jgi:uncharacterized protein (DUF433 family)